jgi:hypothetical protein
MGYPAFAHNMVLGYNEPPIDMKVETIFPLVLRFLGHLALATYGIVALSFLIELPLNLVVGSQNSFLDYFVIGPTFAVPIILGLLAGHRFGRRLPAVASRLLWMLPLLFLAYQLYFVDYRLQYPGENVRAELRNNYVGIHCGGSECLNEALLTAPLMAAFAYTVGAELGRLKKRKSRIIDAGLSQ